MASANILTRLLLNTADFDQKLGKSKKEVDSWSKQMVGMGSVAGGAMKGIAGAAGLAFGAMETFDRIIKANETNNDKWENTMRAVNNSVNEFFSALTSGDFTTFQNGLEGIIQKARDTADALRQIEDTQTMFGYFGGKNQLAFTEQINILRDKSLPEAQRMAAKAEAERLIEEQSSLVDVYRQRADRAVAEMVTQRSDLSADEISKADIESIMSIILSAQFEQEDESYTEAYKAYKKQMRELEKRKSAAESRLRQGIGSSVENQAMISSIVSQMERLPEDNFMPRLYNAVWNKINGEDLEFIAGLYQSADSADRGVEGMKSRLLRYNTSGGGKEPSLAEGSIAWYETEIKALRDKITSTTDEAVRIQAQKTINEYEAQIKGINTSVAAAISRDSWESLPSVTSDFMPSPRIEESEAGVIAVPDDGIELPELPYQSDNIEETADALGNLGGAISNITGLVDSGAAAWASYFGNIIQTVGQAIPLIDALTNSQNQAAAAEGKKAAMGAGSAVSNIPVVGPILAIAAIASVVAALANIPKFAEGGIVGGSSYYGDRILARLNSGEMVLNQRQQARLLDSIERPQQNIHITGRLTASGRDLKYVFDNYDSYRQK